MKEIPAPLVIVVNENHCASGITSTLTDLNFALKLPFETSTGQVSFFYSFVRTSLPLVIYALREPCSLKYAFAEVKLTN